MPSTFGLSKVRGDVSRCCAAPKPILRSRRQKRIGASVRPNRPKVRPLRKKLEEPDLSNRTCPRRFRHWETVGHGKDAMLRREYKQLRVLEALDVPGLRVPNTLRRSRKATAADRVCTGKYHRDSRFARSRHYHIEKINIAVIARSEHTRGKRLISVSVKILATTRLLAVTPCEIAPAS
jgi:hypothetical protein